MGVYAIFCLDAAFLAIAKRLPACIASTVTSGEQGNNTTVMALFLSFNYEDSRQWSRICTARNDQQKLARYKACTGPGLPSCMIVAQTAVTNARRVRTPSHPLPDRVTRRPHAYRVLLNASLSQRPAAARLQLCARPLAKDHLERGCGSPARSSCYAG